MSDDDYFEELFEQSLTRLIGIGVAAVVGIILCALLSGCKTVYVPVETVKTEYVSRTDSVMCRDSIYVRDSVLVQQSGDTVYYVKWRTEWRDRWRDRLVTDTLVRVDSVTVSVPVERKLTAWEKNGMRLQGACYAVGVCAVVGVALWLRRRYKRH